MSNPPAALNKQDELSGGNPGQDISQSDQSLATDSAIQAAPALDAGVAQQAGPVDSGSSTSGGSVYGTVPLAPTVTPPDGGYPPT